MNPDGVDNARGCPRLGRTVTASYVAGVVSGVVQFTDRSVSTTTCAQTDHTKVQVLGGGLELLAEAGNYSPLTGRYAIAVDLPLGATYRVHVPEALDRFAGICGFADSGTRTVVDNDADGDGVSNDLDACVGVAGDGTSTDGCPLVERTFTNLTYTGGAVSGKLKVKSFEAGGCTAANTVWVTPTATGVTHTGQAAKDTGTFTVPVNLADGDDYVLTAAKHLDPAAGWCQGPRRQVTVGFDTDGDGVDDDVDLCDHVEGDDTSTDGCPLVEREFTNLTYADGAVTGTLKVKNTTTGGCTAANPVSVTPTATEITVTGEAAAVSGAFAVAVALATEDHYILAATEHLDPTAGWCQAIQTEKTVAFDTDGDDVRDDLDVCDNVKGPRVTDHPGCPTLERTVSADYDAEAHRLTGRVTNTVDSSACAHRESMQGYAAAPGEQLWLQASFKAGPDGHWALGSVMVPGARFQAVAVRELDPTGLGVCGRAESPILQVPGGDDDGDEILNEDDSCPSVQGPPDDPDYPGCPTLGRTVSASYADGTITGEVSTPGTNACAQPQTLSILRQDGLGETVETDTEADGTFSVQWVLPAGAEFVVTAPRVLDATRKGICATAASEPVVVPDDPPATDTDGDGVGDDADACVTVKGDGTSTDGCPRVEREFTDVTYVNGQLVGQLRVADTESVPEDSCLGTANSNERRIYVALGSEGSQGTTGSYVQSDRSFAFSFGRPLTDGELYRLYATTYIDPKAGWCGAAVTDELTLLVDSDDDGVRDNADKCDHVDGDGTSTDGCPLVEREFTDITYAGGVLAGTLRVKTSEGGGCTAANDVSVTPAATGVALSGTAAQGSGAFEVVVDLADGDDYVLAAAEQLDPAAGWCQAVQTQEDPHARRRWRRRQRRRGPMRSRGRRRHVDRWVSVGRAGVHRHHLHRRRAVRDAEGDELRGGRVHGRQRRVGDPHRDRGPALRQSGPGHRRVRGRGGPGRRGRLCPGRGRAPRSRGRLVPGGPDTEDRHARHR